MDRTVLDLLYSIKAEVLERVTVQTVCAEARVLLDRVDQLLGSAGYYEDQDQSSADADMDAAEAVADPKPFKAYGMTHDAQYVLLEEFDNSGSMREWMRNYVKDGTFGGYDSIDGYDERSYPPETRWHIENPNAKGDDDD